MNSAASYWTLTPASFRDNYAFMYILGSSETIGQDNVDMTGGIRPVINLRADITLTGSGTTTKPYIVS